MALMYMITKPPNNNTSTFYHDSQCENENEECEAMKL